MYCSTVLCNKWFMFSEQVVFQYHTNADTEFVRSDRSLLEIEDVPIFRTVEEKAEFEATLAVDLRCVDHMYKVSGCQLL